MFLNKRIFLEEIYPIMQEQLDCGGKAAFNITGTSMLPFLKQGRDSVFIEKPKRAIKKRDIIFYRRLDGNFILHRVIGKKNGRYICRGDNQTENEHGIEPSQIIGTVIEYNRKGKVKSANCLSHRIYSLFWVNTVFFRKVYRKIKGTIK